MSSPFELWRRLPPNFLKKKYSGWSRLDHNLQLLVFELAQKQDFKCALCDQKHTLEIEHDHDPEHGYGDQPTIYNTRGLACRSCNWQIMMFEKEERGEYTGWDNFNCRISSGRYWNYIYAYERRASPLVEAALEKRLGSHNYWYRWNLLFKFDDWKDGWTRNYPWRSGFEEIKEKRHGRIRTLAQFVRTLHASLKFLSEQQNNDPSFQLSDETLRNLAQIKSFMDRIRPVVEARLTELGYKFTEAGLIKPGA